MHRSTTTLTLTALVLLGACRGREPAPGPTGDTPEKLRRLLETLPGAGAAGSLDEKLASRLVALSIHCVDREYPNKPSNVQNSDREVVPPRQLHPAFSGCFDWHSAVHGHWTMVRILRTFPRLPEATTLRARLDARLNATTLAGEAAYFEAPHHALFERPYGWGWLLRLAGELHRWTGDADARRWAAALEPLERLLARRTTDYLARLSLPVRAGTHHSTAFALAHIHDYARIKGDRRLRSAIESASRRFYQDDRDCPTDYEPSGEDFISPCLAEADLMRRVLPPARFSRWLATFMPMTSTRFRPLLQPPRVLDRHDPKIGHLIGLCFQRAWAMRGIASALPDGDPRRPLLQRLSGLHGDAGLRMMFDSGYGGAHWLASFAVFLLTGTPGS